VQGQESRADLTPCARPAPAALLPVLSPGSFPPPPPPLTSPCCVYLCSHATPCCLACRATTAPQLRAHEPSARHLWVHPGGQHRKNCVPGGTGDAVLHLYCTCTAALRRRNSRPARSGCLLAPVHVARGCAACGRWRHGVACVCFAGKWKGRPRGTASPMAHCPNVLLWAASIGRHKHEPKPRARPHRPSLPCCTRHCFTAMLHTPPLFAGSPRLPRHIPAHVWGSEGCAVRASHLAVC
jgi:hypothetical protein